MESSGRGGSSKAAKDGELGNDYLPAFQDNEWTIPTILTTSQKLSTGVSYGNWVPSCPYTHGRPCTLAVRKLIAEAPAASR